MRKHHVHHVLIRIKFYFNKFFNVDCVYDCVHNLLSKGFKTLHLNSACIKGKVLLHFFPLHILVPYLVKEIVFFARMLTYTI